MFSKKVIWKKQGGCISWIDNSRRPKRWVCSVMTVLMDISDLTKRLLELLPGDILVILNKGYFILSEYSSPAVMWLQNYIKWHRKYGTLITTSVLCSCKTWAAGQPGNEWRRRYQTGVGQWHLWWRWLQAVEHHLRNIFYEPLSRAPAESVIVPVQNIHFIVQNIYWTLEPRCVTFWGTQ